MSSKIGTVSIDILANTAKLVKGMDTAERKVDRVIGNMKKVILSLGTAYVAFEVVDKSIESFIKLENSQIGVAKTTGLVGFELDRLNGRLNEMSVTMAGFELEGIYDIAEAAGQLGITGVDNIAEFTRVIGMVGLTTELSSQESATSFAKLSNSLNEPIENIETLASVANELSNTTTANVGQLLKFSQRLTGGAKTAGLMTDEIFGLSATMIDLAINFETGGTNINRVMLDIISDSNKFAEAIGEDSAAFASSVQNEPITALQKLLQHMNGLSKTDAANFLTGLGYTGTEVKDVLLKLSSNTELLTRNLKISHDEYLEGTSIMKEYEVSSKSLAAQLTKSSAMIELAFANFGSALKEPILAMSEYFLEYSEQVNSFLIQFKKVEDLNIQRDISIKLAQEYRDLKELEGKNTLFWFNSDKAIHNQKIQNIKDEIELLEKKSKELGKSKIDKPSTTINKVSENIPNLPEFISAYDEYGIPNEAEEQLQSYTNSRLEASARMNQAREQELSRILELNDAMIAATGTDYDQWLNETNNQLMNIADSGADSEQIMEVYNSLLQQKSDALQEAFLSEDELLLMRNEEQTELVQEAFENQLITESERRDRLLQLEAFYQKNLTKLNAKGFTERQKFSAKTGKDQVKGVLGDIQATTAGVANGNKTMFNINKAAALANAGISMYEGVSKTLGAFPYPIAIPLAALHAAAGAMQIAQIASSSYGGGGSTSVPSITGGYSTTEGVVPSDIGNSTSSQVSEPQEEQKNITINLSDSSIMSTDAVRELIEAINEELGDGANLVAS
ncbi:MAG: phage tail tape measure protein [Arcobacter sp.]|nr:MAG: phage tail tape measure protein [Arcobacter sp.]